MRLRLETKAEEAFNYTARAASVASTVGRKVVVTITTLPHRRVRELGFLDLSGSMLGRDGDALRTLRERAPNAHLYGFSSGGLRPVHSGIAGGSSMDEAIRYAMDHLAPGGTVYFSGDGGAFVSDELLPKWERFVRDHNITQRVIGG